MRDLSRRHFLRKGFASFAGLTVIGRGSIDFDLTREVTVDKVALGKLGLNVPRIALGTGSRGGSKESNQTRLGMERFTEMAHHAYDRGGRFFDMADSYGSHPYVAVLIKRVS